MRNGDVGGGSADEKGKKKNTFRFKLLLNLLFLIKISSRGYKAGRNF